MAIAFDASSTGNFSGTSVTISHTCSSNSTTALIVFAIVGNTSNVTGVTYNGVSMTYLTDVLDTTPSPRHHYVYYKLGPASGANNIVISADSSSTTEGIGVSYTGVYQIGFPDAYASLVNSNAYSPFGNTTSWTYSYANSTVNNCWKILLAYTSNTMTAGTNSYLRQAGSGDTVFDSNGAIASPGAYAMTVNRTGSGTWAGIEVVIPPLEDRSLSVYDSLTISEDIQKAVTIFLNSFDSIAISESLTIRDTLRISVSDSVSVSESLDVKPPLDPFNILIYEPISIEEDTQMESFRFSPGTNKPRGQRETTSINASATFVGSPTGTTANSL